jgi:hypothetical protein
MLPVMPLPASTPAWKIIRWMVKHSVEVVPPAALYLLSLLDDDGEATDIQWMRWHVIGNRQTPAGTTEDQAQFKLDIVNITGGALDTSWTAGDFSNVDTDITAFMNTIVGLMTGSWTWVKLNAYRMQFNEDDPGPGGAPAVPPRPFLNTGPPIYSATKALSGSGTDSHPYQVAASATFRTGWPRHWGRIYLPNPAFIPVTGGRLPSAFRTTYANALFDLRDDLAGHGFLMTVPVAQAAKAKFHALLGVQEIVVDDIPDVIRRRRPRQVSSRAIGVE